MCDAAGELADRFHLLRLRKLLARTLERQLGLAALGDVLTGAERRITRPSSFLMMSMEASR